MDVAHLSSTHLALSVKLSMEFVQGGKPSLHMQQRQCISQGHLAIILLQPKDGLQAQNVVLQQSQLIPIA
jgi:hypothetical protein